MGQRESEVALNFVTRTSDTEGTVAKTDVTGIDESLGTLVMLAPRISEMVAQVRQQEAARAEAARMAEENCPRIFVEGESDRIVLARALQLFFPEAVGLVRFETKRDGAGHSYVIDMLIGWRSQHKHHPERPKAVGIVDGDAGQAKSEFNKQPDNVKSAKCFVYPSPAPLRAARAAHFEVYASLETLYPQEVWAEAARRNQLVRRNVVKVCPAALANRIILGEARLEDELDQAWAYFVMDDFNPEYKILAAERLCQQDDAQCRVMLANFEPLLREALKFLGIEANAEAVVPA